MTGQFQLTEEQLAIQEMAQRFTADSITPFAAEWDEKHHFPTDVLREAAELGMAAIYCREDAGGSGLRRIDAVRIFEQLAAAGSEAVVLGCTEIELLVRPEDSPLPLLDSMRTHAEAAVAAALGDRVLA